VELAAGGAARTPETNVGDAFTWAFRDPEWVSKLILMGLIGIIPIVGSMQLLGWMLSTLENLRAAQQTLPPAAFRYATRGLPLFLAGLIYGVVGLAIFYGGFFLLFFGVMDLGHPSQTSSHALPAGFLFLMFGTMSFFFAATLLLYLLAPVVILFTDRRGIAGAFDWPGFVHAIRTSPKEALAAGALALVAYLVSGLGSYLCYVGLLFTIPYALTIMAWVLRWFELKARPGALPA
jgi:hypothetical protein